MSTTNELPAAIAGSWRGFLESFEPLRGELFRYCRYLTKSPWDAEDLSQDVLARAFVTLGKMGEPPPNPRAWLFRVASNLWIDRVRKVAGSYEAPVAIADRDPQAAREAAGTLLVQLAPQERAAVVLKDVFAFSLEEIADVLATTVGAVKAALHRGRGKLAEPEPITARTPAPGVLDAFCTAFNAGDLDALTQLLLDDAAIEVVGATVRYGREAARTPVLFGMLFGYDRMGDFGVIDVPPRVELREHRGEWVLLHWYTHADGEAVRAVTRIEHDAHGITLVRNYFYSPDLVTNLCDELGLPHRGQGRLWWGICKPAPS
ncbi:MAG TPA: sigma-70 family RNA polymerase sigma factor [Nannocystaceae bacterium]|nr:sigma-70 family RNA polymerase sigma factor [Nannocystaceae bacterium]